MIRDDQICLYFGQLLTPLIRKTIKERYQQGFPKVTKGAITILLITALVMLLASVLTFFITPSISRYLLKRGFTGTDVHKKSSPPIPEFGGLAPIIATFIAILIALVLIQDENWFEIVVALTTIGIITIIGIYDDIRGMRQHQKIILCALAGLPLFVIIQDTNLGFSLFGAISLGLFYYLFIILLLTTSTNLVNLLAGFNGLETGLGIVSTIALALIVIISGNTTYLILILPFIAALIGFLPHNWYPAKTFPGDTLTLTIGATLATLAILTKTEFYLALLFIPHFLDFFLKTYVGFKGRASYGNTTLNIDGTLTPAPYPALAHKLMQLTPMTERRLVITLIGLETIIALFTVTLAVLHYT